MQADPAQSSFGPCRPWLQDLYHDILRELVSKAGEDLKVEKYMRDLDVNISEAIEDAVQKAS